MEKQSSKLIGQRHSNKWRSIVALMTVSVAVLATGCEDERVEAQNRCADLYDNNMSLVDACNYGVRIADGHLNRYTSIPSLSVMQNAERALISNCQVRFFNQGLSELQACENGVHLLVDVAARRYHYSYPSGGFYRFDYQYHGGPVVIVPYSAPRILVYPHPVYYYDHSTWFRSPRSVGGGTYTRPAVYPRNPALSNINRSGYRPAPVPAPAPRYNGAGGSWGVRPSTPVGSTWGRSPSMGRPSSNSGSSWGSRSSGTGSSWGARSSATGSSWGSRSGSSGSSWGRRR